MSDDETRDTSSGSDDLTAAPAATDPGSLSDVAAATTNDAAKTALDSSAPAYTEESDGRDPHVEDAPGAGRGSVADTADD